MAFGYGATQMVLLEEVRVIEIMLESSGNVLGVKASRKHTHNGHQ